MSDLTTDEKFYDEFNRCFVRNAKFSVHKPIPNLGFATTPIDEVKKFYKFWDGFKTWRTFNQYDEFDENDLDNAEDRYEKRWMEKQNDKNRKQYDKAERKRIYNFVNVAYENDPRILAERKNGRNRFCQIKLNDRKSFRNWHYSGKRAC